MGAVGEEFCEPLGRLRDGIRPRDADDVEALRARFVAERLFQRACVGQKSRSA